jgi:hypothetical protein
LPKISRIISTPSIDHVSALNFGLALYIFASQGHASTDLTEKKNGHLQRLGLVAEKLKKNTVS